MNKLFTLIGLLCLASLLQAQQVQSIKGMITDKQSNFPLIGANVIILNTDPLVGTISEIDGSFRIDNVPIGRHTIQVTYLGYVSVTIANLVLNSAKELDVNIIMEEQLTQLDVVVISAQSDKRDVMNQMATVSARTVSVEEASRFSGSLLDPARMAQNYAGVSGASDDRNDIIIRGNSPLGVLWRMEGINIPSPNHFATLGSTGGPIGMLNINNLRDSDFYTSAWSADYGNALSGVFDVNLRNGNRDKREYIGQIGFNGIELGAEGPFVKGKKASYLINYRYSTLGVFDALGINLGVGTAVPEYQDVNFKVNIPTENLGTFTVWGIGGLSEVDFENTGETDSTNLFNDYEDSRFGSKTGIVGISNTYFLDDKSYTKWSVVGSGVQSTGDIDTIDVITNIKSPNYYFDRKQYKLSSHLKYNRKLNKHHTVAAGLIYDHYYLDMQDSVNIKNEGFEEAYFVDDHTNLFQSYINWQYRRNENWTFNLGLHEQYFSLTKSHVIEPRLGLKYEINDRSSINFGVGMHSMLQPIELYFEKDDNDKQLNLDLDFSKAYHTVLGYDKLLTKDLRLKLELYYQYLYNIPIDTLSSSFSFINAGADFILPSRTGMMNEGTGENYGMEITLEKFFSKGYYFLATGSFFESKYLGSDGIKRNTLFNGNYVVNGLAGKEFKIGKNNTLSFDAKVTYAGGRRYTPIDLISSKMYDEEIRFEHLAFSKQYDPYFKVDFKVSFKMNGKKVTQEWAADFTNLTNQKNIFKNSYSEKLNTETITYQRGFFPVILYRIYF